MDAGGISSAMSLLPGRNPAGTTVTGDYSIASPAIGSSSGQNPIIPTTNIPAGSPITSNGYGMPTVGSGAPAFGANSGGYTPVNLAGGSGTGSPGAPLGGSFDGLTGPIGNFGNLSQSSLQSLAKQLSRTYGAGTAQAIMDFLAGGAGFNPDAVNNMLAALQPGFNRQQQDLIQQFSTSGNRFGSGAQIGVADLMSQQLLNEGQIESQMYEQSVQDYINTLLGVANTTAGTKANSPSALDSISPIMSMIGAGAGAASAGGVGGTAGTILDIISSLGAAA